MYVCKYYIAAVGSGTSTTGTSDDSQEVMSSPWLCMQRQAKSMAENYQLSPAVWYRQMYEAKF